ncbi:DUF397 domain-containing protein [Actinomadura hibisca]|uniref:DUF397 domain-containing protein n=1 Tax=Actinomadura hibisca TaxID=68565 RepID=UPI0009FF76A7|nr:DUF397 domain-containing protein [Actinomadura hibisca]
MERSRHLVITVDANGVAWRKYSNDGGQCVEAAHLAGCVGVRDSTAPAAGHLVFPVDVWDAFSNAVKSGRYDFS